MSTTGERIKKRRKQLGINADALADYLGVSRSTIFRYENGDIEKLPANLLSDIAKFLKTSESYLMGWEEEPEKEKSPKIMQYYEMLNDIGRNAATEQVRILTEVPRYLRENVNYLFVKAAHNDAKTTNEELERMQRDVKLIEEMKKKKQQG